MEYILQIMLGTFMQKPPGTEKVLRTLEQTYDRIGPQDIIVTVIGFCSQQWEESMAVASGVF